MRDDMTHCPHPARNGRHEVYARPDGSTFCRACGKEFKRPAFGKSQSSRVRIDNVEVRKVWDSLPGTRNYIAFDPYQGEVGPRYPDATLPVILHPICNPRWDDDGGNAAASAMLFIARKGKE